MAELGRVEDYFVGLLHGVEKEAFERHLATCARCQKALKELRQLDARLREELPRGVPEEELLSARMKELFARLAKEAQRT